MDDGFNATEQFNQTYEGHEDYEFNSNGTYNNDTYNNGTYNNGTFFEEPRVETKAVSVYTPLLYVTILVVSLFIFASQYRKSKIRKISSLPSIFDESDAKDLYIELLSLSSEQKVHEKVLKAGLLNRGAEAIRRSLKLKELAPQVEILYKNGSIGDDYWQRYQTEVKLVDVEFKECIQEAERLQPGWVPNYVPLAREICLNQALTRRYQAIAKRREVCVEEWGLKLDKDGKLVSSK
ncbi:Translocation protein SEC66 [Nakaseomyces bracarensis]|uniref:Translocation protein SEC66 n=1 Tax=Nakaseomyces bracarensis TaxID=273131 RepID=A0ABR4P116_9SACH